MEHILSLSYGKDSLACLGAIEQLGLPLDRIVHAEIWATDTIPADLPPMIDFKKKADAIIKDRWGIEVEHIAAKRERERDCFERLFYKVYRTGKNAGKIWGFPFVSASWCSSYLKVTPINSYFRENLLHNSEKKVSRKTPAGYGERLPLTEKAMVHQQTENRCFDEGGFSNSSTARGANTSIVQYLGIAADEPKRIERHKGKPGIVLPLVEIGWDEDYCYKWCEENDLLSPIYTTATRGGCWFCHNQGVGQLRQLRRDYPEHWQLMLKWDKDSPVTFKPDGHTVHDYERRFALEDDGLIRPDERFRWAMLDDECLNYRLF